jgi:hypothetical protein
MLRTARHGIDRAGADFPELDEFLLSRQAVPAASLQFDQLRFGYPGPRLLVRRLRRPDGCGDGVADLVFAQVDAGSGIDGDGIGFSFLIFQGQRIFRLVNRHDGDLNGDRLLVRRYRRFERRETGIARPYRGDAKTEKHTARKKRLHFFHCHFLPFIMTGERTAAPGISPHETGCIIVPCQLN